MTGTTDLQQMLATLEPSVRDGEFVYVTQAEAPRDIEVEALVREDEGLTLVLRREVAEELGLAHEYVAGWITLTVHSSLEAVGLTAAFSTALGEAGISCNVLAGFHHDHLLVPHERTAEAVDVLRGLSGRRSPRSPA